jgi:uncharacterized protein (TIGR02001 family)
MVARDVVIGRNKSIFHSKHGGSSGRRLGVDGLSPPSRRAAFLLALATCFSAPLHAQSTGLTGVAGVSSQLVDRGVAITPDTPTFQGAVSWSSPAGWSFSLSGSSELRSPGRVVEATAEASRYWSLSTDWQMQASLLYYSYPSTPSSRVYDRAETSVDWIYRDVLTFGVSAIHVFGGRDHQPRGAADIDLHWPLPWNFSLSTGAGIAQSLVAPNGPYNYGKSSVYRYGHAGLTWETGPWRVELDRILVERGARRYWGNLSASPWVATISRSF